MGRVLSNTGLAALERKYRALVDLREKREVYEAAGVMSLEGEERDVRLASMKKVANEFPGALRELESLTVEQLRQRAELIASLDNSIEAVPLWLEVVWEFHCITKSMLLIKEKGKRKQISEEEWAGLLDQLLKANDTWPQERLKWLRSVDVKTINRYLSPESRRMVDAIWLDLSVKFGQSVDGLQALVFGGE